MNSAAAGDQHWTAYGACGAACPDALFVEGAAQRAAREVCEGCAVRLECLIDALDHRVFFGVWGGMTERERRALMRRFPEVRSWRELFEDDPRLAEPAVSSRAQRHAAGAHASAASAGVERAGAHGR